MSENNLEKKESCHFCNETNVLETHHIVPRRYGGSDNEENLVTVCPTCHRKLESMYNNRFYNELGVSNITEISKKHNHIFRRVEVPSPTLDVMARFVSFDIRMDSTDHFQFYCPECGSKARIDCLYVHKEKEEFSFALFCDSCGVAGSRKIYPNPDRAEADFNDEQAKIEELDVVE